MSRQSSASSELPTREADPSLSPNLAQAAHPTELLGEDDSGDQTSVPGPESSETLSPRSSSIEIDISLDEPPPTG